MATKVMYNSEKMQKLIIAEALKIGFVACGITSAIPMKKEADSLRKSIGEGRHAGMKFLENNLEKRENPGLLVEGAQSVISCLVSYKQDASKANSDLKIAKYAWGKDYHIVVKDMLYKLLDYITKEFHPEINARIFVDSAPVFEKPLAVRAGLGWIGKNSLLITRNHGSFVFIGEIISDLALQIDPPFEKNYCGSCQACINNCPTGAISKDKSFDVRKCNSFYTIEHEGPIPENIKNKLNGWIYGCDICQDVCPWNKKTALTKIDEFRPFEVFEGKNKLIESLKDEETFRKAFDQNAILRIGYNKMKSNLDSVAKNEAV